MGVEKTFTDIRFFLKTPETVEAFETTNFFGPDDEKFQYPSTNFDNNTIQYPVSNLTEVTLSEKFQIKSPTSLGEAHVEGDVNLISDDDIFAEVGEGDYIFYKLTSEDPDELKVLGRIFQKINATTLVLEFDAPIANNLTVDVYKFSRNDRVANFDFSSTFYMLVKNVDYTTGNHDGILSIDRYKSTPPSVNPVFAYSSARKINPAYFSLQRISKINSPGESQVSVTNIESGIKGISKYSEKSMFENRISPIPVGTIPYWSVYEVNPYITTSVNLDKNTIFRVVLNDVLPADRVFVTSIDP